MSPVASVEVSRPQRWDEPFGAKPLSSDEVARILSVPPFSRIDHDAFSPAAPLLEILRNDTRIVRCAAGDVICRKGDHGTSTFFILSGTIRVVTGDEADALAGEVRGSVRHERRGFFRALAQLWENSPIPESRDERTSAEDERVLKEGLFLQDVPSVLTRHRSVITESGSFFGEMAALGRTPRTATIFAENDAELLEIRWQGLRDIHRRAPEIQQHIDTLYREHALELELKLNAIFQNLTDDQ